jgi:hypothetical protein
MRATRSIPTLLLVAILVSAASPSALARVRDVDSIGPSATRSSLTAPTGGGCLNFDDLLAGTEVKVYQGVRFSNSDGPVRVVEDYPGPAFSPPNVILPDGAREIGNKTRARPPVLVNAARVTLGDWDADEETIYLNAYDMNGNLLAADTDVLPETFIGGVNLGVQTDTNSIAYVEFYGTDPSGTNTVYFDNVCFRLLGSQG